VKYLTYKYNDQEIVFTTEAWFNATQASAHFGKEPVQWLRQQDTVDYLIALVEINGDFNSGFVTEFNKIKSLDTITLFNPDLLQEFNKINNL
jgi:hypothetical protein